ncbi:MAG: archease [wastewater metagenome]|nr:archease [Candidatus Loosdrechtia aerotolerans]
MPYEYLEEIAIADIAFRAWGKDLEEVFISASDATMNVMVESLDTIQSQERREVKLEDDALDMLLFNFLQEFIYYKDAEQLLLRTDQIHIKEDHKHTLVATLIGEKLNPDRHGLKSDVKAVTLHRFSLEKNDNVWEATVILDV